MSPEWVEANFKALFPIEFPTNCLAALDGLAFAPSMKPIFDKLISGGVVDWALRQDMKGDHARESILQRLGLSYLWGDEQLDGPRFAYLFNARRVDDLREVIRYFWRVRGEPLTDKQKERICLFWDHCVAWSTTIDPPPADLLSQLSLLTCYLSAIDARALKWLLAIAPYTPINHHYGRLMEELVRLAVPSPKEVGQVLRALLDVYRPDYDFENRLSNLLMQLAANGETRPDAIFCLERVRHLPGMVQLYAQLT